jgi:hypothetical protein
LQAGAGAQAGAQVGAALQQSSPLLKRPFKRENKPGLEHPLSQAVAHPPPQLDPDETTAGAGAGATAACAGSAPTIQAEVSMNNVAFTITSLRKEFGGAGPGPLGRRQLDVRVTCPCHAVDFVPLPGIPRIGGNEEPTPWREPSEDQRLTDLTRLPFGFSFQQLLEKRLSFRNHLAFQAFQRKQRFRKAAKDREVCVESKM